MLVLVVSGGLFIAGIAADRAANTEGASFVSQQTWRNGPWPLAIDQGHLVCTGSPERPLPWFRALLDDRREMWPLDDAAMAAAAALGPPFQPAIIPIQLHDTAAEEAPAGGPVRLSVDALRRRAITLGPCKGEGGPSVAVSAAQQRRPAGGVGSPASGSRVSDAGAGGTAFGAGVDAPRRAGDVFRDCAECPEMVVLPGDGLAMGRYEVTVGEYRAFVSATGGTGSDLWRDHDIFRQTDRHPVVNVSWDDARAYVSWLSRTTMATYRLPTEAEWERAAAGSPTGCGNRVAFLDGGGEGTCEVGTNGTNAAGLSDMVGNVSEWMSDCWEGDCGRRVLRGGSWFSGAERLRSGARNGPSAGFRHYDIGFRVSRTLP